MTERESLAVYDKLREAHSIIKGIETNKMSTQKEDAIETVSGVLYLAEHMILEEDT